MSEEEEEYTPPQYFPKAAETLPSQIGSERRFIEKKRHDPRILTNIDEVEALVISHFLCTPKYRGGRYARRFFDHLMYLKRAVGGRGSTQMIQMVGAEQGTVSGVEFAKRPGVFARNIWRRGWKEKAEEEGKAIVE